MLPESPKSARKKEEARQAEFVRIGQVRKEYTNTVLLTNQSSAAGRQKHPLVHTHTWKPDKGGHTKTHMHM